MTISPTLGPLEDPAAHRSIAFASPDQITEPIPDRMHRTPDEEVSLAYHRLARLDPRTGRWWRPLTAFATVIGLGVVGLLLVSGVDLLTAGLRWLPGSSPEISDSRNPSDYLLMLGLLAVLTPATVLGVRWGWRRPGTLHSVAGRFRWRLMARAALVVGPVFLVVNGVQVLVFGGPDPSWPGSAPHLVIILIVVVTLTPLQCAAEEYLFRALPQQILGTWLRLPWWGIVAPVPLFVLGHGYDWVGKIDIAVFGLAMGFLVWKTGGVELAILVHTSNNLTLFLMAPLFADSLLQGDVDPWQLAISLPLIVLTTAGLTWWTSRHFGVRLLEPIRTGSATLVAG